MKEEIKNIVVDELKEQEDIQKFYGLLRKAVR